MKNSAIAGKAASDRAGTSARCSCRARAWHGPACADRARGSHPAASHRPGTGPSDLQRACLVASGLARLLLPLGAAFAGQENLLGDEDAVAQNVALGELEAVGADGAEGLPRIGMAGRDRVEALVQVSLSLVEDHVQAVLLGVEVVIQGGRADADVIRDVRPLRVLVPVAAEPVDGCVQNLSSPGAFVAGRRVDTRTAPLEP